jgi:hypothetical protein
MVVLGARSALAEDAPPRPTPAFLSGPSIYETGRVGTMYVSDQGSRIERTSDAAMPKEQTVQARAQDGESLAPPSGRISAAALERDIEAQFASLQGCRIEVARQKQVALSEIAAGQLTLRWTILPSGGIAGTEVVAMESADSQLIDCVKRRMSSWSFAHPRGGSVRVSRTFQFR